MVEPKVFPLQINRGSGGYYGTIPQAVALAAYKVYSHVYGPQEAIINRRLSRAASELARSLPFCTHGHSRAMSGSHRIDEALSGLKL